MKKMQKKKNVFRYDKDKYGYINISVSISIYYQVSIYPYLSILIHKNSNPRCPAIDAKLKAHLMHLILILRFVHCITLKTHT